MWKDFIKTQKTTISHLKDTKRPPNKLSPDVLPAETFSLTNDILNWDTSPSDCCRQFSRHSVTDVGKTSKTSLVIVLEKLKGQQLKLGGLFYWAEVIEGYKSNCNIQFKSWFWICRPINCWLRYHDQYCMSKQYD